ncbi:MAG TPA: hypothetical protein VF403_27925 [Kofleriaceae bacterium]
MLRRFCLVLSTVLGCGQPPQDRHDASAMIDARVDAPSIDTHGDAPVGTTCIPDPMAGHRTYDCEGISFDVEVPQACVDGGHCGLILDVHGLTMSAAMEEANDKLRTHALDYVIVQPNANPAPPQASWGAADEPKVFNFLMQAITAYSVDTRRVHMTGFSQGGFMTWRFLCAHADVFASVAPAAAASNCPVLGNPAGPPACSFTGTELPSRKISILYMHGSADHNYIPFSCAQPQVDAIVGAWGLTPNGIVASSPTFTRTRWSDGSGTVLEFLAHDYSSTAQVPFVSLSQLQGHCFPGSTDPGTQPGQLFSFKCEQPASFVWGSEVVDFFRAHPGS